MNKAKKVSENTRPVWVCQEGCSNDKRACPHLEKLLDKVTTTHKSLKTTVSTESVRGGVRAPDEQHPAIHLSLNLDDEREFIAKLQSWGLSAIEVEILASLYLYGDTYDDIMKQMGWKDRGKLHSTAQLAKNKVKAMREAL